MARTYEVNINPEDPNSIAEALSVLLRVVDREIEFGHPQNPIGEDATSSAQVAGAAGGAIPAHNGVLENIRGSWVEIIVDSSATADTKIDCVHNLNVPMTSGVAEANVRWMVMGIKHSGLNAVAASTISVSYETGDSGSITADSFPLRVYAEGTRTVNDANPIKITLFFIPAVRWPD